MKDYIDLVVCDVDGLIGVYVAPQFSRIEKGDEVIVNFCDCGTYKPKNALVLKTVTTHTKRDEFEFIRFVTGLDFNCKVLKEVMYRELSYEEDEEVAE